VKEPAWVEIEDCLAFHAEMLARFGGLDGVRDPGLLESALNRPKHLFAYEEPSLFDLAASYAHGIAKNHPFIDGNKRSAFMAAALFLEINGERVNVSEEQAVVQTLALAAGSIGAAAYAAWLRSGCRPAAKARSARRRRG
jgi:death-on-curing protein